jgi:hypothetical protein
MAVAQTGSRQLAALKPLRRRLIQAAEPDRSAGRLPFHSRCPIAQERCKAERPALRPVAGGALAACHFV